MFSPNVQENTRLIDVIFITGINSNNVKRYLNPESSFTLTPEIFLAFPESKNLITPTVLDFIYPNGITISIVDEPPKFHAIILTNDKGIRSYIYTIKFYEKTNLREIESMTKALNITKGSIIETNIETTIKTKNNFLEKYFNNEDRTIYLPVALCLWSSLPCTDFFRKLLIELYTVVNYKGYPDEGILRNYRFSEIINYFIFFSTILKPPPYSRLDINLHFSSLDFYMPSKFEIPYIDSCIRSLFDSLEISTIIKLWIAILTEKQIILYANQCFLIYVVAESLLKLIFPFKWLHTYIPILPKNQLDYLEAPTPYIMGVLSSTCDFEVLKKIHPNNIICDINTSQIYYNSLPQLPSIEESKLRKKIQLVKSPEIFEIEDILSEKDCQGKIKENFEDIHSDRSFEENIQYIFFRILRNSLGNYKKYMNNLKVFNSLKFLEDLNEQYRDFWEKILQTQAFEYFILCSQYLDDSNTKIFNNMLKLSDDYKRINKNELFTYTINLPYTVSKFFIYLENKAIKQETLKGDLLKEYLDTCRRANNDYNIVMTEKQKKAINNNNQLKKMRKNMRSKKHKRDDKQMSNNRKTIKITKDHILDEILTSLTKITDISENITLKSNNLLGPLNFYGKDGFIQFLSDLFEVLKINEISEIGLQSEFLSVINKHDFNFNEISNNNSFISDMESISEELINISYNPKYSSIIEIPKSDSFQYYLIIAYHLEEFTEKIDKVFEMYLKTSEKDKKNFPKVRFYQLLDNISRSKLISYNSNEKGIVSKIIKYKIKRSNQKKGTIKIQKEEKESLNVFKADFNNRITLGNIDLNEKDNEQQCKKTIVTEENLKRSQSFFGNYDGLANAELILNSMKSADNSPEKIMTANIINYCPSISLNNRDPISLSEDISVKIFSMLIKIGLNKYKHELFSSKLFQDICNSEEFISIKESVSELQKINLKKIANNENLKLCFWLNIFNFLTIFAIISKKEILSKNYEWYRFLKNTYYCIGGYEISLYEIENCILRNKLFFSTNFGDKKPMFDDNDIRKHLALEIGDVLIHFGIFLPSKTSVGLKIFFPNNILELLRFNAIEYFSREINVDIDKSIIMVPELLIWIDPNNTANLTIYEDFFPDDLLNYYKSIKDICSINILKYDWTINFCNIKIFDY